MCPDVGTGGHTQWFYFRVDGLRKGVRYRFNVTNFAKADSLYLEGMQPLVWRRAAKSGVGWRRAGKVVCYSKNTAEAHRQQVADMRRASGLAIDGGDDGERAGSGSASDGESDGGGDGAAPDGVPRDARGGPGAVRDVHAAVPLRHRRGQPLRPADDHGAAGGVGAAEAPPPRGAGDDRRRADGDREGESRQRRLVVLSSRVHPGESNASWVMQGILDFLTSDDARAVALRRHFVFKICPMLNPDGVIQGNYRCSNSGTDLNRQWSAPSREAHPPVAALKHLIRAYQTRDAHRVALFCDLHGHSRAKGVFLYGILSDADRYGLRARRSLANARESASAARDDGESHEEALRRRGRRRGQGGRRRRRGGGAGRGDADGDPRDGSQRPPRAGLAPKLRPATSGVPLVLAKAAYGMFTKKKTTFRLGRGKAGTARHRRPAAGPAAGLRAPLVPAPTPTPTPISSPLRSSLLRHRPSEAPARLPVDLDAVSDRVSGELERPDRDGSDDDSSAASRGAGPYLLDVDDRVLAEEIRDQPAPRVSFNMSRPGSRASLNFPVVPAAANAPPAEGAAPALPERRPEPPPDSRPSSNDADHRKHRTLSDEKSAS
ncbi:hypothetical protein JL722_4480 [Aureococcus anophagefferens]|nr:hypothetical protein JL722_4480 [Aureococcus anophagefferens]